MPATRPYNLQQTDPLVAEFARLTVENLPYEPNGEQWELLAKMAHFIFYGKENAVLLLNGYAGTGKTSMTGAMVKAMNQMGRKTVLLAPTGRAAKVFTEYAGHSAYTIHRRIYRQNSYLADGFSMAENKHTATIFIVDEASMVANNAGENSIFGTGNLLDDLIHYVYNGLGCRLVLMGDVAQLPPVGQASSPAMNPEVLKRYGLDPMLVQLTAIARQDMDSGILYNATLLRQNMQLESLPVPKLQLQSFPDIEAVSGEFLLETISDSYASAGMAETAIITRSNKRATQYNMGIRNSILYREDLLVSDEMLLVVKNNYYWSAEVNEIDFIANGDMLRVSRVWGEVEYRYGLRFANVTATMPDHDDVELDVKIILDCLTSDTPGLTVEQSNRLYTEVMNELSGDRRTRHRELKKNPYFNALQVKYAYAITCHKAQGGQWQNVFIDMGAIMPEAFTQLDFYRWLYTALTRARHHVYLINCPLEQN